MHTESSVDAHLAAATWGGDQVTVEQVLRAVQPMVVRYCRARLGRSRLGFEAADDVAQEVCLAVALALPNYDAAAARPFLAYVYGVAAHKVADAYRGAVRQPITGAAFGDRADLDRAHSMRHTWPAELAQHTFPEPEEHTLRAESTARAGALLNLLTPRQREIVTLRVVAGLSVEEVAAVLGSTPGAVRVAQHRAVARLRTLLLVADRGSGSRRPGPGTGPIDRECVARRNGAPRCDRTARTAG